MSTLLLPNTELVTLAWLALVPGFTNAMLGTTLPRDEMSWTATGFVKVGPVVGGSPNPYNPQANPVIGIDCYAVTASKASPSAAPTVSNKPPWGKAAQLAEQIRQAAYALLYAAGPRHVAMPVPGYAHANIQGVSLVTEPRRMPGDAASYARYTFDLRLTWVAEAT